MTTNLKPSRTHAAMPFEAWPQPDQAVWLAAIRMPDFPDPLTPGAAWRPASRRSAMGAYGRLLAWMASQGIDLEAEGPVVRITRERMRSYVAFLETNGCAPVTVASYLGVLCMAVKAMFPDIDWTWLVTAQKRLQARAVPARAKHDNLVPADKVVAFALELIAAAGTKLDEGADGGPPSRARVAAARDYRDGLIIGLLALRAPREENLLGIEIAQQLQWQGGRPVLRFPGSETKNHRAHLPSWPAELVPALDRYLRQVRGILLAAPVRPDPRRAPRPPGQMLWLAQGGTPLTAGGLAKVLKRHIPARFGTRLSTHRFRDCLATTIAGGDAGQVAAASALLGHEASQSTGQYIAASSAQAAEHHQSLIASLRKKARREQRMAAATAARPVAKTMTACTSRKPIPLTRRRS